VTVAPRPPAADDPIMEEIEAEMIRILTLEGRLPVPMLECPKIEGLSDAACRLLAREASR